MAPNVAALVHALFIFLSGTPESPCGSTYLLPLFWLHTHSFVWVYAPTLSIWLYAPSPFIWVYVPTFLFGFMHPPFQLGLCTLMCHWDYAPSFAFGTMHPHLLTGLHTLIFVWVTTPCSLGSCTLYSCSADAPVIGPPAVTSPVLGRHYFFHTLCAYYLSSWPLHTHIYIFIFSPEFFTLSICLDPFALIRRLLYLTILSSFATC
jgi:hypothetical protein